MTLYFLVKYFHVLGAIVILGTGTGIAFFMLMAHRTNDAALTPDLWIEPLGALVKTGPAIVLMLVALLMLDNR